MKFNMKKLLLLAVMAMAFTSADMPQPTQEQTTYVYVCTGPSATRYHRTPDCSGLNRCSREIKKITLAEAEKKGRTACKKCF